MSHTIDMRSDTVTRPTAGMRDAMMRAKVGDDVLGDDPSVNALQEQAAALFGKEAALFVPSGTMANQVCIRTHTEPGDEIIVEATSHIFLYEGGGFAALSGVSAHCVPAPLGLLGAEHVRAAVRAPGSRSHYPVSKLLCVENTANRSGGTVYNVAQLDALESVAREYGLRTHLDGARVMNAAVALGVPVASIAAQFDSISFCLSKGLGCPVGSLILGSQAFVDRAHRFRKMFGGGMRQSGFMAAAGLYALEHHIDRLAEDHRRARSWAEAARALPGVEVDMETVQTNMVYVDVSGTGQEAAVVAQRLHEAGVWMSAVSATSLRAVFHLDIDDEGMARSLEAFKKAVQEF